MSDKPLFIPLKREYFEAFKRGDKTREYRPHGKRWNVSTCRIGRRVTLSLGYGKAHRLHGVVSDLTVETEPQTLHGWTECYGDKHGEALCIGIKLDTL